MQQNPEVYDVAIIGGGPAGCACALALKNSGLNIILIEKNTFPRDKVCGDAIPGIAVKILKEISVPAYNEFVSFAEKMKVDKTVLIFNKKELEFQWVLDAYTCSRIHFDNFLFSMAKKHSSTKISEGTEVSSIEKSKDGFSLAIKNSDVKIQSRMLLGADGVNGYTSKKLAGNQTDKKHHVGAIRQYWSGISGLEQNKLYIYLDKKYRSGYFWIFPLQGGAANVGFGMLSQNISAENFNLKKIFSEFIEDNRELQEKFSNAKAEGLIEGCGIPLGSRWIKMSGEGFLLAGDAASLVEPIGGDGIGNAILSGKYAAHQIKKCFEENNFSAPFMKQYDNALYKRIGAQMKKLAIMQNQVLKHTFLLKIAFYIGNNKLARRIFGIK